MQPMNDAVFLSASQDGTIRLYDARASTHAQQMMQFRHEQNCAQFHPNDQNLFLASDTKGHLSLFDLRSSMSNTGRSSM